MKFSWKQYDLKLKHTFRISRGARDIAPVIILELEHDGIIGYGESSPSKRYGETPETVVSFFQKINVSRFETPFLVDEILTYVDSIEQGNTSAKCAVDIALHDWMGKKLGVPLYQLWGLNPKKTASCSFTIAIDSKEVVEQKVREAEEFPKIGRAHV